VKALVLENTHNRSGGVPVPPDYVDALLASARAHGVPTHLDGARVFDAACAHDVPPARLASRFDTVSLSLNKAFGAPLAASLSGTAATIERALTLRQRLGGGLRPTGPIAAATLAGLDDCTHFSVVHELAARLATGLAAIPSIRVEAVPHRTNIVIVQVDGRRDAAQVCSALAARGLLVFPLDAPRIRLVVYRGISADDVDRALEIVCAVVTGG